MVLPFSALIFALARAVVILIFAAISIVHSLFKAIEHVHLSESHVTFREAQTSVQHSLPLIIYSWCKRCQTFKDDFDCHMPTQLPWATFSFVPFSQNAHNPALYGCYMLLYHSWYINTSKMAIVGHVHCRELSPSHIVSYTLCCQPECYWGT